MRKLFLPIIAVLACMLGACSDEIDYTVSNDCIITGFSLGQVKRTMQTKDSEGKDSTYTINYNAGSYYPMTIDQINNKIYNKDSLPYGSQPKSILASISAVGSVAYCIAGEAEPEWKMYSSSDSIDFSYLLTFRVMSNDGKAYRDYEMKLNIHQQDGEQFEWQKVNETAPLAGMEKSKALFWNNRLLVLSEKNGVTYTTTRTDGNWTQTTANGCEQAVVSSLTAFGNKLYLNTTDGRLLTSDDAVNWSAVAADHIISHLIAGNDNRLYALTDQAVIYSTDGGATWVKDSLDTQPERLPQENVSGICYSLKNGNRQMVLTGTRPTDVFTADTTAMVWSKLFLAKNAGSENPWMYYPVTADNIYPCPNLANLSLIYYNNCIIAFGGKPVLGNRHAAYDQLYVSHDNGITWKSDEEIVMPQEVKGSTECVVAAVDADQFIWLVDGSTVWKGRLNELGFD